MGINFTIVSDPEGSRTIPLQGGILNLEYPIRFADKDYQKSIGAKANRISNNRTKFLSTVSVKSTSQTITIDFVIGGATYTATYRYNVMDNKVFVPSLSNSSVMKNVGTGVFDFLLYQKSQINIYLGYDVTFVYVIVFKPVLEYISLSSRVQVIYSSSTTVVAATQGEECPTLISFAHTDYIGGTNMRSGVFRMSINGNVTEWIRPINITRYVLPKQCGSLVQKIYITGALLDNLMKYSAMRYFLWFLLTGEWCLKSLLRRNTKRFFYMLSNSEYACYVDYFGKPSIRGYSRYFIR